MQCIVTYATDTYSKLPKMSSEIHIFNYGHLSSGHCMYTWARMWGSVVIFQSQNGSASKRVLGKSAIDNYTAMYREGFNTFNFVYFFFCNLHIHISILQFCYIFPQVVDNFDSLYPYYDWGDLGVDGRIILWWISRRWDVCIWTGLGWPRIETGGGRLWVR